MKDIRFRAWDKDNKEMRYTVDLVFDKDGKLTHLRNDDWVPGSDYGVFVAGTKSISHFELIQFTGLYDANKNPIYEGDIIRCHDVIFEVYYDTEMAMFNIKRNGNITTSFLLSQSDIYVVIGNIYQNPELLER